MKNKFLTHKTGLRVDHTSYHLSAPPFRFKNRFLCGGSLSPSKSVCLTLCLVPCLKKDWKMTKCSLIFSCITHYIINNGRREMDDLGRREIDGCPGRPAIPEIFEPSSLPDDDDDGILNQL